MKVFITGPSSAHAELHALREQFAAAGYASYDWSSVKHAQKNKQEQSDAITHEIMAATYFVHYAPDTTYIGASYLQWALAMSYAKPILLIDPLVDTRTAEACARAERTGHKREGDNAIFARYQKVLPNPLHNLYGCAILHPKSQWVASASQLQLDTAAFED